MCTITCQFCLLNFNKCVARVQKIIISVSIGYVSHNRNRRNDVDIICSIISIVVNLPNFHLANFLFSIYVFAITIVITVIMYLMCYWIGQFNQILLFCASIVVLISVLCNTTSSLFTMIVCIGILSGNSKRQSIKLILG